MNNPPTIGSLFSGYGGLDIAVEEKFGARTAWHAQWEPPDKKGKPDTHQYAAAVLAHHWPGVPNHGNITEIDFTEVEPVNILTGGFPCTDVSLAGLRAGLNNETRSGLWSHMARAIRELRPELVVIENVRGLLSTAADGDMEPCTWCMGDRPDEPVLRALGAVLGDLADLGFDAEWVGIPASAVGAPHPRFRVFILAWPSHPAGPRLEGGRQGRPGGADKTPADPHRERNERAGQARREPERHPAGAGSDTAVQDPDVTARRERRIAAPRQEESRGTRPDAGRRSGASADGFQWGSYRPAVERWERITGNPAPVPVDDRRRLAPGFVEWMMGLPDGWLTAVPLPAGMSPRQARNAQLKAAGNGVVPQQAYAALDELWYRATH